MSKSGVGNLKWIDSYNCEQVAESDTDKDHKAEALQKNFSSVYITEPYITTNLKNCPML